MADTKEKVFPSPLQVMQPTKPAPPPYADPPPPYTEGPIPPQQGYQPQQGYPHTHKCLQQQNFPRQQPHFQQPLKMGPPTAPSNLGMTNSNLPYGPNHMVTNVSVGRRKSKYFVHDLDTGKDYLVKEKKSCNGRRSKSVIKERGGLKMVIRQTRFGTTVKQKFCPISYVASTIKRKSNF